MYTVIGIERKRGTYEGRAYDNTIVHATYEKASDENVTVNGQCVVTFKSKTEVAQSICLGDLVSPLYDRYGNVVKYDLA